MHVSSISFGNLLSQLLYLALHFCVAATLPYASEVGVDATFEIQSATSRTVNVWVYLHVAAELKQVRKRVETGCPCASSSPPFAVCIRYMLSSWATGAPGRHLSHSLCRSSGCPALLNQTNVLLLSRPASSCILGLRQRLAQRPALQIDDGKGYLSSRCVSRVYHASSLVVYRVRSRLFAPVRLVKADVLPI